MLTRKEKLQALKELRKDWKRAQRKARQTSHPDSADWTRWALFYGNRIATLREELDAEAQQ